MLAMGCLLPRIIKDVDPGREPAAHLPIRQKWSSLWKKYKKKRSRQTPGPLSLARPPQGANSTGLGCPRPHAYHQGQHGRRHCQCHHRDPAPLCQRQAAQRRTGGHADEHAHEQHRIQTAAGTGHGNVDGRRWGRGAHRPADHSIAYVSAAEREC